MENRVISSKEYVEAFAEIAEKKGYQTLSCDFPEHGERMSIKNKEWRLVGDYEKTNLMKKDNF